ncbi:MAG TPA: sulfotransferase [Chloroflexota bacterium]
MSRLERPIFVVGCPRSGTTLVQCILSASTQAFSLPESHFFSWVLPTLGVAHDAPVGVVEVRRARQAFETESELRLPPSVWSELESRPRLMALDIFLAVVEHFRPAPGPDLRAIEKTPRHVLHLDAIGEAFPDAVFVNVVRNPVDVVSSLLGVPFASTRSMLSHAQRWLESIAAAQAYASARPGRLQTVVYESLVREPEAQVRAVCAFANLEYEPAMLEEFGREATRNVLRGEAWKQDVSRGVIVDRQGVWRSRMTPGQAWLVSQATRAPRRDYGYVGSPSATPGSIVRAMLREASVRYAEARSSAGPLGAARHAGSVLKTLSTA